MEQLKCQTCDQLRAEVERLRLQVSRLSDGTAIRIQIERIQTQRDQWRAVATSFQYANDLHDLMLNWTRQDDELNSARMGLEPEDRINECEENNRINESRKKQVEKLALAAYERLAHGGKQ